MPVKGLLKRLLRHCLLAKEVISVILSFLGTRVVFVAENTLALIVLVAGFIGRLVHVQSKKVNIFA